MIVCLHGFTGCAGDFGFVAGSVRPALVGHAHELAVPPAWRWGDEVLRLGERLAALAGPLHLCGYSLGARLALAIALARPAAIARLTLIAAHPGLEDDDARTARRADDRAWADRIEHDPHGFADAWQAQPLFASQRRLPAARLAAQRAVRAGHDARALAAALVALSLADMPDHWPRLGELTMPVALVTGALDDKFAGLATRAAQLIPRARHHPIADVGHNPVLERPDQVLAILRSEP